MRNGLGSWVGSGLLRAEVVVPSLWKLSLMVRVAARGSFFSGEGA